MVLPPRSHHGRDLLVDSVTGPWECDEGNLCLIWVGSEWMYVHIASDESALQGGGRSMRLLGMTLFGIARVYCDGVHI